MKYHIEEKQEDGTFEARTYEFDWDAATNDDIGALEEETGWSFTEFNERRARGEMRATTAQVWMAKRREDPKAKFATLVFRLVGMDFEASDLELRDSLERLNGPAVDMTPDEWAKRRVQFVTNLTDAQRTALADLLDPIPTEAPAPSADAG